MTILENKLNINNQIDLAKAEEKISKQKAKQLFDSGDINISDSVYTRADPFHYFTICFLL